MAAKQIVAGYARMWPRGVFERVPPTNGNGRKKMLARSLEFLEKPGVYILYRNDTPYYIGQAETLRRRLWGHAKKPESRYYRQPIGLQEAKYRADLVRAQSARQQWTKEIGHFFIPP